MLLRPAIRCRLAVEITLVVIAGLLSQSASANGDEPVGEAAAMPSLSQGSQPVPPGENTAPQFPRTWQVTPWLTARFRGRIDTDAIWTSQSAANEATYGDLGSAVGLRRARVGLEGQLGDNGHYVAEIDLASGQVVPQDIYVGLGEANSDGEKRGGHFREPFSLEGGTSANSFAFMERSPINMLDPARNWGLGCFRTFGDETGTLAMGMFQQGTNTADFESGPGSTAGFTQRVTLAPIYADGGRRLLHFGMALSREFPSRASSFSINSRKRR